MLETIKHSIESKLLEIDIYLKDRYRDIETNISYCTLGGKIDAVDYNISFDLGFISSRNYEYYSNFMIDVFRTKEDSGKETFIQPYLETERLYDILEQIGLAPGSGSADDAELSVFDRRAGVEYSDYLWSRELGLPTLKVSFVRFKRADYLYCLDSIVPFLDYVLFEKLPNKYASWLDQGIVEKLDPEMNLSTDEIYAKVNEILFYFLQ